ncbi:MAG: FadD3 family acyl-CoA ligase [Acidimicrobiales bacterium]
MWGSVPGLVAYAAERFGVEEAVVDRRSGMRLTFEDLSTRAIGLTRAIMAAGVGSGDRVAIWAPNGAPWAVAALGSLGAGGVLVPLNTRFKGGEAAYVLRRAKAKLLFCESEFLGNDYPSMLEGEELPDLDRIVLLDDAIAAGESVLCAANEVPIFSFDEFRLGSEGVVEGPDGSVGRPVSEHDARNRWQAVRMSNLSDVIFTSGTTGKPKGVMATHAQTLRTFAMWSQIVGLEEGDRYLVVNPFFHTFGYKAGVLACLMRGATVIPEPVFDVDRVLEAIAAEKVTVLPGPPTLFQSLLDHPRRDAYDLSSLRLAVTGAAVVPVELVRRMRAELTFETVLTAYGLTESTGVVTMCRRGDPAEVVAETSGRAIPEVEVKVVDEHGRDVAVGDPGEVLVRGYTVTQGYLDDVEATAETVDPDGWLHTGDVGVLDDQGNLRITDRIKDMFIVGGFNAYPAEIEGTLLRHPAVAQAAVVGVPDERLGEVGHAFVVPRPGADPDELVQALVDWAREHMANYKVPRVVELVDSLPTNASGKVTKDVLRRRARGEEPT